MWFKRKPVDGELFKVVASLRARCDAQEEALEALRAQHVALRGRVYALWGKEPPGAASSHGADPPTVPNPVPTKAELRRQLTASGRFVPGKPPVHSE